MMHTKKDKVLECLYDFPVIAALKNAEDVELAIDGDVGVGFILGGSLLSTLKVVKKLNAQKIFSFVHVDLIGGLGTDEEAIRYIAEKWQPAGIITTRKNLIKSAKSYDLLSIQRMFLLDSTSIRSGISLAKSSNADFVELVPGLIPKAIECIKRKIGQPIITGGMITSGDEAKAALSAGAVGISTSATALWQ